jgi:hypothetical protein
MKSPDPSKVTVFEAVNETLKEFYIGTTTLPAWELENLSQNVAFRKNTHWEQRQQIVYRVVEEGLSLDEALAFIKSYAKTALRTGWKVVIEQ